jgi:hypothetical protein
VLASSEIEGAKNYIMYGVFKGLQYGEEKEKTRDFEA